MAKKSTPTPGSVGAQIRAARIAAGLSGSELARRAGFTQPLISKVESGGACKISTLQAIADALQREITIHPSPPILKRAPR